MPDPARPGPVPAWLGRLAEPVYAAVIGARNRRFDRGRGVERVPVPVVSIGNLSVGGTGKTPIVGVVVSMLRAAGVRTAIALRGYARGAHAPDGDEAALYRSVLPGVPVIVGPDRAASIRRHLHEHGPLGAVVLDDGFQHRRLARDLDLVLVDASRGPLAGQRLLPAGWLRDPPAALARAHGVIITHAEAVAGTELASLSAQISALHGRPPLAVTRHAWAGLADESERRVPTSALSGQRVVAACAIGNPGPFLRMLAASGARVQERIILPDHDPLGPRTVRRIGDAARRRLADAIVVTEKDWTKLARAGAWPCPVLRPRLVVDVLSGEEALRRLVLGVARPG
ncbi:MAG TPA: tetraacyldisaccharide 4'-kinase [Phycisphaerales bacterium]|nr:tetraacyldisaccharide 4'-kinase [Phycisphaerales bacterium]